VKSSRERASTTSSFEDWKLRISYAELLESTNGFSENNLIGSGSFGSVYKGVLSGNGTIVAVKVLNLQRQGASKIFIDECIALRSISHRNLLKIISACSSIDHKGNGFKSLIFEFMCKSGAELRCSLGGLLPPQNFNFSEQTIGQLKLSPPKKIIISPPFSECTIIFLPK
jgi:serine/threonine protein kinase